MRSIALAGCPGQSPNLNLTSPGLPQNRSQNPNRRPRRHHIIHNGDPLRHVRNDLKHPAQIRQPRLTVQLPLRPNPPGAPHQPRRHGDVQLTPDSFGNVLGLIESPLSPSSGIHWCGHQRLGPGDATSMQRLLKKAGEICHQRPPEFALPIVFIAAHHAVQRILVAPGHEGRIERRGIFQAVATKQFRRRKRQGQGAAATVPAVNR